MDEQKPIALPAPPFVQGSHSYYFIYGEWTQIAQESPIATPENPNPEGRVLQRKVGMNECIAMHPAVYFVVVQQARPGYTVKWATGISKELYNWYQEVQRKILQAMEAQRAGQKEPESSEDELNNPS